MRKLTRRRRLSMTSLIDVIFLLLLFFMLSSTFSRFADVELAAAGSGASGKSDAQISFLKLGPETLSLNGQDMVLDSLTSAFDEMPEPKDVRAVIVSLEPDVTAQRLTNLLVVLRGIDSIRINVLGS